MSAALAPDSQVEDCSDGEGNGSVQTIGYFFHAVGQSCSDEEEGARVVPFESMRGANGGCSGLRRVWGMPATLLQGLYRNRSLVYLVLGLVFIVVALATHIHRLMGLGSTHGTRGNVQRLWDETPLVPTTAGLWYMCAGDGQCSSATRQRWAWSPATLADSVGSFLRFAPGVKATAWRAVTDQWNATQPPFKGSPVSLEAIAIFIKELLTSDPFMTGGEDVPWVDLRPPSENKVVAVSQRQLAFIVANVLMGNTFANGAPNGLSAALHRCGLTHRADSSNISYLLSLLSFLAVLSRELGPGSQGKMLVGAVPRVPDDSWKTKLSKTLAAPMVCKRVAHGHFDCGLADFMSGGTPGQALTDIAGGVIGGGAQLCSLASSQDESLVQFYSEVLAFSFFAGGDAGMLPVPFTMLGARRYMNDITGEAVNGNCGVLAGNGWLNEDISTSVTATSLAGAAVGIPSAAFVGVASVCSACQVPPPRRHRRRGAQHPKDPRECSLDDLRNNQCDAQRRHVDQDVTNWYQAFEPMMYELSVHKAYRAVVSRIGTGPWGAGVWYGDSQQSFLTVWLATGLLGGGIGLDYYIYPSFCENQGNQCFVLGSVEGCEDCAQGSGCNPGICGPRGISDVIAQFKERPIADLYTALTGVGKPPRQVFDLLTGL